jgi:hypothetical protein
MDTDVGAVPEADENGGASAPPRRASALTAIGTMSLVALVVTGGVVAVMRFGSPAAAERPAVGAETEVPTALAGGIAFSDVPPAVAQAVDGVVVGARVLTELPAGVSGCDMGFPGGDPAEPELESAVATPDGLLVSEIGTAPAGFFGEPMEMPVMTAPPIVPEGEVTESPAPVEATATPAPAPTERIRNQCTFTRQGGGWMSNGGSSGPVDAGGMGMGMGATCCDAEGMTTTTGELVPPDGATWALQDRGVYWLAYPVADLTRVPITWRFREGVFGGFPSTHVLWVDDDGTVLDERFLQM